MYLTSCPRRLHLSQRPQVLFQLANVPVLIITIPGSTLNRLDKQTKCMKHVDLIPSGTKAWLTFVGSKTLDTNLGMFIPKWGLDFATGDKFASWDLSGNPCEQVLRRVQLAEFHQSETILIMFISSQILPFITGLKKMSGVSGVFPINLRFAFGNSFGSFLTKLSHMDPCLGMCFTSHTFVLHHCLYQILFPNVIQGPNGLSKEFGRRLK